MSDMARSTSATSAVPTARAAGAAAGVAPATLLATDDLGVVLDSDQGLVRALEAVQLTIARGETFALVGESGCGKSMTALALMRLLPDNGRIASGSVRLDGADLLTLPESGMRAWRGGRIGIIFQDPATSLNPVMRVGDQVVEAIVAHTALRGAAATARAIAWLEQVGLPEPGRLALRYPFELSGGQKQRVMIAIALAAEPALLIADEPTTALDVTTQAQILALLADLQRSLGMALLLITHDLAVVARMAHRVALMYAGQIVELATVADFFAQPSHPYARQLLDALPDLNKRGQSLASIAGTVPALTRSFPGCRFAERCSRHRPQCDAPPPVLVEAAPDHWVRCVLYAPGQGAAQQLAPDTRVEEAIDVAYGAGVSAATKIAEVVERVGAANAADAADSADAGQAGAAPLLEVRDLRVWFPIRKGLLKRTVGYVKAVDGVGFSLAPGKTLALVGESGCGKTTVARTLLQLLRSQARISGAMRFAGRDLADLHGKALLAARRDMQIVFQDPFASLDPRMRVAEILEEGMLTLRPELGGDERRARILALLDQVGLRADALTRYPHEFSGGQRQRLVIARALAVEPRLIVCDEPTSALDVSVQAQILNLLKRLQREHGFAYLFITHNLGVVEYLADDVAVMQAGHIVEAGPATRLLTAPQAEYTRSLLAAVPRLQRAP